MAGGCESTLNDSRAPGSQRVIGLDERSRGEHAPPHGTHTGTENLGALRIGDARAEHGLARLGERRKGNHVPPYFIGWRVDLDGRPHLAKR